MKIQISKNDIIDRMNKFATEGVKFEGEISDYQFSFLPVKSKRDKITKDVVMDTIALQTYARVIAKLLAKASESEDFKNEVSEALDVLINFTKKEVSKPS